MDLQSYFRNMKSSHCSRLGRTALLLAALASLSAPALAGTAALLPLSGKQVTQDEADILTDALINELSKTGAFQMMERSQMDQVLKEQGFQQTGACDAGQCAVEMGRLLGIQTMMTGSIGKLGNTYVLSTRMVDVKTGTIVKSASRNLKGSISDCLEDLLPEVAKDLAKGEDKVAAKPMTKSVTEAPKPAQVVVAPKPKAAAVETTAAAKSEPAPAQDGETSKTRIWPWLVGGTVVAGGAAAAVLLLTGKKSTTTAAAGPADNGNSSSTATLEASWDVIQ